MSRHNQFQQVRRIAEDNGLYVLKEGSPSHPSYRFLSTKTGRFLARFDPVTMVCYSGDEGRRVESLEVAVETAVEADRR